MGYLISGIRNFSAYVREFGLGPAIRIVSNNRHRGVLKKMSLRKYNQSFYYRLNTTDFPILRLIIGREMVFKQIVDPKLIIDAGANAGYVSVYYAKHFPDCEIFSIELEESNFELLKMNTASYPNVKPIQAALWNHSNGVSFGNHNQKDSFNLFGNSEKTNIAASVTLTDLVPYNQKIDLLKLDIEGAEIEILEYMKDKNIEPKVLVVELHDRFREGCSASLERYLEGRSYKRERIYEYDVIVF